MIQYSIENSIWTIKNESFIYKTGLKDNKCHHISCLPVEVAGRLDCKNIMKKELQPEAEVHINNESRMNHHGARWIGCSASSRAVYKSYNILEDERCQTLIITSIDEQSGLEINNHYTVYNNSPAMTRYVKLKNTSSNPIDVQHLGSFSLYGIPFFSGKIPGREVLIHSFPSSWCWEGQMKTMTAEEAGLFHKFNLGCWHIESTGSWSCKEYMPFFVIEETAQNIFWCVQLEYSGSWRFEIGGPGVDENCLYVQGGIGNYTYSHWLKKLMPGEEFQSIKVSLSCIQGDIDDALNSMQKHRGNVLINRSKADKGFPVIFNEWNSTQGAVREETMEKHLNAIAGTGVEIYVIDAGWNLKYYENMNPGDWFLYAGDWKPHPSRFPGGIKRAADKIIKAGMIAGIWIEIEVAAASSQAYIEKAHLFMKNESGYVEDNMRRCLYFGNPEAREYATKVFEKLIDAGFRYFKIDYNNDFGLGCCNGGNSMGQGLVEHIRGYYEWLDELRGKYPDIIVENCSSGGNRMDYGMLGHTDLASITDQSEYFRLGCIFFGVSKVIHPSQMGNWSILKENVENKEFIFTIINSMMARMHISGEIEKLSDSKKQIMIESISFYKKWRDILEDVRLYHHTPNASLQYTDGWVVLQMNNIDASRILLGAWRLKSNDDSYVVKLREIDTDMNYITTTFPGESKIILNGGELAEGFNLHLDDEFSAVLYGIEILHN